MSPRHPRRRKHSHDVHSRRASTVNDRTSNCNSAVGRPLQRRRVNRATCAHSVGCALRAALRFRVGPSTVAPGLVRRAAQPRSTRSNGRACFCGGWVLFDRPRAACARFKFHLTFVRVVSMGRGEHHFCAIPEAFEPRRIAPPRGQIIDKRAEVINKANIANWTMRKGRRRKARPQRPRKVLC
jgi:hypothetical protein